MLACKMAAKRPRADCEVAVGNSKHRQSGFNPKWSQDFPFVVYTAEKGMLCSLCQKWKRQVRNRNGTWITVPCTSLRRDSILEHVRSNSHNDAVKAESDAVQARLRGGIAQAFDSVHAVQRKALIGGLKCMYWLAKHEIAHTTNFESLLQLAVSLGSTYISELHQGENAKYTSQQSMFEFVTILSQCIERNIQTELDRSEYISLLCDETTDISITKQLIVYVRYALDGELRVRYFKISDLKDGTAVTIEAELLSMSKIVGFGSDGASVMVGRRNGVATRLKSYNPSLISVHCVAHRLALAAAQAADTIPYLKKFKKYVSQIFYYYHNSSVRSASLKAIQEVLDDPVLKTKAAEDTRWLSHDQAISTIRRILPSIIAHTEKEAEEKGDALALGIVHVIRSYYFVASVYLLSDVLPHLSRLSRLFQERDIDFSKVGIHVLETLKIHDGPYMQKLDTALKEELSACRIVTKETDPHCFQRNVKMSYIEAVVDNLKSRFPDVCIISAFGIFNPE